MNKNTNNLQITITRDGQPDPDWLSKQRRVEALQTARTIGHGTLELLAAVTRPIASCVGQMATSFELEMHDYKHGTHLRDEWFEQRRELATAALRGEVGL